MAGGASQRARDLFEAIRASGFSIYEPLQRHPELVYGVDDLEARLSDELVGRYFPGPVKTRSKLAKAAVCEALGYPASGSFRRVQPRFPGQDLDVFVQGSNNLQIWNQDITPTRR
jgi:hypothetical protein